jgi:hypothetical protein
MKAYFTVSTAFEVRPIFKPRRPEAYPKQDKLVRSPLAPPDNAF